MGLLSALFGGKKPEDNQQEKQEQKNFEILKYDGIRARNMNQLDYAIRCFEQAIALREDPETLHYLSDAYIKTQRLDEARIILDKLIKAAPDDVSALITLAHTCYMQEDYGNMDLACQQAISLDEKNASAHYLAAKAAQGMGNALQAIARATQAIALDESFAAAYRFRAETLWEMKQAKEALEDIGKVLSINPDDEDALLLKGTVLAAQGQAEEAGQCADKVLEENPFNEKAYVLKGRLLAGKKAFHDGQAHKSRIAGAAAQSGDDRRPGPAPAEQPVGKVAQRIAAQRRAQCPQPEAAMRQRAAIGLSHDVQEQQRQGQFEHIEPQHLARAIRQQIPCPQEHPHPDDQKHRQHGPERNQHDTPPEKWMAYCAPLAIGCPENSLVNQTVFLSDGCSRGPQGSAFGLRLVFTCCAGLRLQPDIGTWSPPGERKNSWAFLFFAADCGFGPASGLGRLRGGRQGTGACQPLAPYDPLPRLGTAPRHGLHADDRSPPALLSAARHMASPSRCPASRGTSVRAASELPRLGRGDLLRAMTRLLHQAR